MFHGRLTDVLKQSVELEVSYTNKDKKRYAFEVLADNKEKSTFSTEVGVEGTTFNKTNDISDSTDISSMMDGKSHSVDNGFTILAFSFLLMIITLI